MTATTLPAGRGLGDGKACPKQAHPALDVPLVSLTNQTQAVAA